MLGLLAEGPVHGYDLLERFRERSMGFWVEVGKASVYQTLRRLERRGLVGGRAQPGTEGPDRRVYRITKAGRARLSDGLAERFGDGGPYETGAGLALGFAQLLSPAQARSAVAARQKALQGLMGSLAAERDRAASEGRTRPAMTDAMLDRQEALARAELDWLATFKGMKHR